MSIAALGVFILATVLCAVCILAIKPKNGDDHGHGHGHGHH